MAESETALANRALLLIGQNTITSLTDNSREARAANILYSQVRDSVLSAHAWNCATKRVTLSALGTAPAWGFDSQFQLPADFIRLIRMEDMRDDFRIEGGKLLTSTGDGKIRYVYRLEDVSQMDDALKDAIAYRLAAELAATLKGSINDHRLMMQEYESVLGSARLRDSQQAPTERMESSTWVDARSGGGEVFRSIESG